MQMQWLRRVQTPVSNLSWLVGRRGSAFSISYHMVRTTIAREDEGSRKVEYIKVTAFGIVIAAHILLWSMSFAVSFIAMLTS